MDISNNQGKNDFGKSMYYKSENKETPNVLTIAGNRLARVIVPREQRFFFLFYISTYRSLDPCPMNRNERALMKRFTNEINIAIRADPDGISLFPSLDVPRNSSVEVFRIAASKNFPENPREMCANWRRTSFPARSRSQE